MPYVVNLINAIGWSEGEIDRLEVLMDQILNLKHLRGPQFQFYLHIKNYLVLVLISRIHESV